MQPVMHRFTENQFSQANEHVEFIYYLFKFIYFI